MKKGAILVKKFFQFLILALVALAQDDYAQWPAWTTKQGGPVTGSDVSFGTVTATTKFITPAGVAGTPIIVSSGDTTSGFWWASPQDLSISTSGVERYRFGSGGQLAVTTGLAIGATPGTADTILARDAANTLAQRNGTNAQTLRIYNTFTDASNYERGTLIWNANQFTLQTDSAGTGAARTVGIGPTGAASLQFQTNGANRAFFNSSGHFLWNTDNAVDIGASGATRPRSIYVGTDLFLSGAGGGNASAGAVGEYWEAQCAVATSGASQAFTSASPTVGTWASPPWTGTGVPFGSFACPFQITANAPTGLSTATNYWAVPIDATTFHVSTSAANAAAGTFANTSGSTATANLTSTLVFTSTAGLSVAQMNLTAGDWDCYGSVIYVPGATTSVTNLKNGIGSSSTVIGGLGSYSDFETAANVMTATNNPVHITPPVRQLLSATTASYLVGLPTFSASTLNGAGDLRCRRMR